MSIADVERRIVENQRRVSRIDLTLSEIDRQARQAHVHNMKVSRQHPLWIGLLSVAVILAVIGSFIAIAVTGERAAIFALAAALTAWAVVAKAIEVYDRNHA